MSSWFRTWGLGLILTGLAAAPFAVTPAAAQPDPVVSIESIPGEVLIGETFTVTVEFSNQGDQPGFGPYLVLCVPAPGADGDALGEPCDGFFFKSASAVFTGQTVSLTPVGPPLLHSPAGSPISCQGLTEGSTNPLCKPPIPLPPGFEGCQLVFLPLPFGSFYPGQPPVKIEITLQVHSFADPGTPLPVKVIGGFQFGSSPTGTGCSEGSATTATTVPTLFKVRKLYLGPEGETTTGPNFPRPYRIEVDVADGQTLDPLVVTEDLPDSLIYLGPYGPPVVSAPPPGTPNGQVVLDFGQVTGTASATDAAFEFQFYAGDKDANGNPVLDPATCKGTAVDDVRGEAGWVPLDDQRDTPGQVTSDVTPEDHVLELECLAVQKKVSPVGPHIPGDELIYTLDFQVSDYVQTKDVIVTDVLSDGLLFLTQPAPTLTFTDKNGAVLGTFTLGTDATVDDSARNPCGNGTTVVRFDVSQALAALTAGDPTAHPLHQAGVLTGGEVGPVPPSVAAVGTITYHARIEDEFHCPVPSKDQSVDKHDPLSNRIDIAGEVLELAGEPGATTAQDDSGTFLRITHGQVKKTLIARNGDPNDPLLQASPPLFAPGDTATFRLSYCFPSSDAEKFRLEDFLPSPVFDASQVTGVTLGPNDQLGAFLGSGWPKPCLDDQGNDPAPPGFADASKNSLCFDFGSFDDPQNQLRCVEILFTVPVTAEPFADGLLLTNTVRESEQSSFEEPFDQTRIDQLELGQPAVRVSKGAVSACCSPPGFLCTQPVGTFAPPTTGPVFFNGPILSCGIRFQPPLTSAGLTAKPVRSDVVGGVQAGDRVLFAVVVENTGSSPHGAFDIRIQESLPPGLKFPPALQGGIALCVEDGAGLPLLYDVLPGGLFGSGIELVDPGPTQGALAPGAGNTTGSNLAVLTYILEVDATLDIGACAANRAAVATYAGTEGGTNHVAAGLGGPHQQSAQVCRKPALAKSVVGSSEDHTKANNGAEELTIGELVRFRLVLEVPQGVLSDLRIEDPLPPGFTIPAALLPEIRIAFVSTLASGLAASSLAGGPSLHVTGDETTVASVTPSFAVPSVNLAQSSPTGLRVRLGDLTNAEDDCDREFVVIEFNALVGNDVVNQSGREAINTARGLWDGQSVDSNPVKLRIVEPRLQIDKDMPEGRAVRLRITNEGTSDAFDVVVIDELPESLCLQAGTSVVVQPSNGATVTVSGKKVEVKIDHIPVDGQVVIGFEAFLCGEPVCEGTLNIADVTWTSLPGPKGTVTNPTGSATPGASGMAEGERNGEGGAVNTYHDRDLHDEFSDCPPDLAISKVCTHELFHPPSCTIVVTNLGPGHADSVTLNDVLPPDAEAGFTDGMGWACTGSQVLSCAYDKPLAPGEQTAALHIVGIELANSPGWPLIGQNCARVLIPGDDNPVNDLDCDGACPDPFVPTRDLFYINLSDNGVDGGFECAQFNPADWCSGTDVPFKGDCGCGCLRNQLPPDIAVTKTCPAAGPGVCQILVQNVGGGPAVGTLTLTDTLAPGVTLLKPVVGTNWKCDVTTGVLTRVTCTWEGPPLAAGQSAPPLSLHLIPKPGTNALPRNCARATLLGDANDKNDLGCSRPPKCLDPTPSFIHYKSKDPSVCAVTIFQCKARQIPFSTDCGCGCFDCPGGPWC